MKVSAKPDDKREPNPVTQVITTRAWQTGAVDAAVMLALYAVLPSPVFWHGAVPANAVLTTGGLCAYFASVFVPGVLPQPVPLLGVPPRFFRLPPNYGQNIVALTFDDGPHPDTTPRLLDVLHAHHAKATFFLVGKRAEQFPHLVARIAREGHTIGVHGLHHRTMVLQTAREITRDLHQAQALIENATGTPLPVRLLRPPYGFKTWSLCRAAHRAGWKIVDWSLDVRDYEKAATPAQLIARFERGLVQARPGGGEIVLLHEQLPGAGSAANRPQQTTLDALPGLLRVCKERGLRCVALT